MAKLTSTPEYNPRIASLLIRIGLAIVFAYAAIDAFREPGAWISFIPAVMTKFVDAKLALDVISVVQLVLAAVLVWGRYIKQAALVAIALLGGIMVTNIATFLVTFRDIGLVTAAAALLFLDDSRSKK